MSDGTQIPMQRTNNLAEAFKQGLIAAGIAFLLFALTVGFKVDINIKNELTIVSQYGYLFNYVLIAGIGRFTWRYFGGGIKGAVWALFPSLILFIMYRAWLYYQQHMITGDYDFSQQLYQLVIAGLIIAVAFAIAWLFLYSSKDTKTISKSFYLRKFWNKKYAVPFSIVVLLLYPVIIIAAYFIFALFDTHLKFPVTSMWINNLGVLILIYIMLAWGLNVVVGFAGLLDLGYVGFYAVGAYTVALLGNNFGFSFWLCLPIAGILAAITGMMVGFPVLRLRGDYLAIVTLAFGQIVNMVLNNWTAVTGGSQGLSITQKATFFGIPFNASKTGFASVFGLPRGSIYSSYFLYYAIAVVLIVMAFVIIKMRRLPIGRAWEALREDEIACRSLGINTVTTKLSAFAFGAMFAGFAGAFYATRQGQVGPESFVFMESAMILAIVVLGGMGSLPGIAIAAIIMIGGQEALRFIPSMQMVFGPDFDPIQYRMLWFGLIMTCIMIWKPKGFVDERTPTVFLKEKKAAFVDSIREGNG